jgi:hypothetical protein
MARKGTAWLVSFPIALVGMLTAHAVANAAVGSPGRAGEVFASAASGGELVPVVAALAAGAILLGLIGRVARRWCLTAGGRSLAMPFALLPPLGFILLELGEGFAHGGGVGGDLPRHPTFLFGLALQLPFALVGYVAARALLRLSDGVRALLARRRPLRLARPLAALRRPSDAPPPRVRRGAVHSGRAPPAFVAVSG